MSSSATGTAAEAATERRTLLVVDDEPDVVKSVQDLLRYDYRVLGATSAEEARSILAFNEVHVVMSDQRMPDTTGVEFLRDVREAYPDAVRLLFTGYADVKAVIDAINQGNVYRYITKPWDPDELQATLRDAVRLYDLRAERTRLLEELRRKNEELEVRNADLKQANDLKTAFIGVASHELRTPITILLGLTDLAASLPDVPAPLPEWHDRMHRSADRLRHLTEQIISMLEGGQFQQRLERRYTNLSSFLAEAIDDVRPFIETRKQSLVEDYPAWPSDLGSMAIDAKKLRECVNQLLLNAIKFTPDGGTITVWARRSTGDDGLRLRISDTGGGIAPDILPHVFEPFFAGFDVAHHSSGRYEYMSKGIGLGLSVVKAFVELHGGTVTVETEPARGTTFTMTLPGYQPDPAAATLEEAPEDDENAGVFKLG